MHADPAIYRRFFHCALLLAAARLTIAQERDLTAQFGDRGGEVVFEARSGAAQALKLDLAPVRVDGVPQQTFTPAGEHQFINALVRVRVKQLGPRSVAVTWSAVDGLAHDFEIALADNSNYYGGGERFNSLNQKGMILPMTSSDHPEDKGVISYKPVPFFMSTRGYGAWLDRGTPSTFDFNATDREHVLIRIREAHVRLVLIDGPDFVTILDEFTRLTGRPRVPPAWAFAPWKSRDVHRNREEVLADAELTRWYDLPGSVIVIDSPWETGYNDFVLNEKQFSAPASMFARLNELGFYPCLWLTPFINVENKVDMTGIEAGPSRNFAEASRNGYLVKRLDGSPMIAAWWKGRGGLVDFTNPAATAWWQAQFEQTRRWGARAIKCDDGEGNFVQDAVFFDGSSAAEMKGRYAAHYLQAAQDYLDSRFGGDGVLLARCGFTGTQAQPFCWAGDNAANFSFENGLPSVVLAGQNAALSGIPMWGSDIAGYMGRPNKELFIRWTQFAAFSPLMQVHMTSNLGPWDFDEQTLAIYRRFAKLHTALYPYIRDAAEESARSGMPIIRSMVLAFPHDGDAANERYQYMFGPDLLVAPMIQPGAARSVYLPKLPEKTMWIDYWTGERHAGGAAVQVDAPLDRIPLFVRGGALICMLPNDVDTLIPRYAELAGDVRAIDERRVLQVWPGGNAAIDTCDGIRAQSRRTDDGTTVTVSVNTTCAVEFRYMAGAMPVAADRRIVGPETREFSWRDTPELHR